MLVKFWKPIAVVAIVASCIVYRTLLVHQRDAALTQAQKLQTELSQAVVESEALRTAIAGQNGAVQALHERLQEARTAAEQRELHYARKGAEMMNEHSAQARAIENAPLPSDCSGAIKWGNGQGLELGKW
jgi:predicted  nucleic acid-binding Zn-ribbon protein